MISLQQLNTMPAQDFVAALAGIFEHSPWVAEQVAKLRPFASTIALHQSMCGAVMQAGDELQLKLIRAHPELAGRAALRGTLTRASTSEQLGAGLSACAPAQLARLQSLNAQYTERFGFPFVLAVRGHSPDSVIAALAERVTHEAPEERRVALQEIGRIAYFRLADLVDEPT
jgi:OHCU decarboxylase